MFALYKAKSARRVVFFFFFYVSLETVENNN